MILNIEFYVNGLAVDFYARQPLTLTKQNAALRPVGEQFQDFTYTFKLPLTQRNRAVFGLIDEYVQRGEFARQPVYEATITVNGYQLIRGELTVTGVDHAAGELAAHIVSDAIDWSNELSNMKLTDLAFDPIPFTGWRESLANLNDPTLSFTPPETYQHSDKYDWIPIIIAYGTFFVPNIATGGNRIGRHYTTPDGDYTFDGGVWKIRGNDGQPALYYGDVPFSIYVVAIIRAMFRAIGWGVTGAIFGDSNFKRLIIPFCGKRFAWNWGTLATAKLCRAAANTVSETNFTNQYLHLSVATDSTLVKAIPYAKAETEIDYSYLGKFDDTINGDSAGYYRVIVTGWYSITLTFDITNFLFTGPPIFGPPTDRYVVGCVKYKSKKAAESDQFYQADGRAIELGYFHPNFPDTLGGYLSTLDETPTPYHYPTLGSHTKVIDNVYLEEGEVVYAYQACYLVIAAAPFTATNTFTIDNLCIKFEHVGTGGHPVTDAANFVTADVDVNLAHSLPDDASPFDWLTDFANLFGLYFTTDQANKRVSIYTYDELLTAGNQVDLTAKANLHTATSTPPEISKRYEYKWAEDSDDALLVAGEYDTHFEPSPYFQPNEPGAEAVEIKNFAPCKFRKYSIVFDYDNNFTSPRWVPVATLTLPSIASLEAIDKKQNDLSNLSMEYVHRIIKVYGRTATTTSGIAIRYFDDSLAVGSRDVFDHLAENIDATFTDAPTLPGYDTALWSLSWRDNYGLFKMLRAKALLDLISGRIMELDVYLTEEDFVAITSETRVVIDGVLFLLEEIKDFDAFGEGLSTVILRRI